MKYIILIAMAITAMTSYAQESNKIDRIKNMSEKINDKIQNSSDLKYLSRSELNQIQDELKYLNGILRDLDIRVDRNTTPALKCTKQGNGRYYISNPETYAIVGSKAYNASYANKNTCSISLPKPGSILSCIKQGNGRFYVSKSSDLSIMGSIGYNASYPNHKSCATELPAKRDVITCAKVGNGRYYPVKVSTYEIVGPTGYNASYPSKSACMNDQ